MRNGAFQMKRYLTSAAGWPPVLCGHTSTLCPWRLRLSKRTTMPPLLPDPDALDQMTFVSTGSGVAKPLSPPSTPNVSLRGIEFPERLFDGTLYDGPSWRLPYTRYGMRLSTVAWYICAMGSWTRNQV